MSDSGGEQGRVLVVEDDASLRLSYERVLKREGWTVECARDGLEAHERMGTTTFDAVVSDVHMPGYGGLEFLRRLRATSPTLPVILVTGRPNLDSTLRAIEFGVFRFLVKPVGNDVLATAVKNAVAMHRAARPVARPAESTASPEADGARVEFSALVRQFESARDQIWIANQPIVSWGDRKVFGYETLLRTNEPALARPQDLIAAAAHLDRLHEVGRAVRLKVAESLNQVPPDAMLFLNVHARDLEDANLLDSCSRFGGIAHRVVLEITERSHLATVEDLVARIRALKQLGFRIAVDDTGAGYGGLTAFAHLDPDVVKLGMRLVRNVDQDPKKQAILRAIVRLCGELRITVVAEGVETASERDALVYLGCDLMQGYLFARAERGFPLPVWK